MAKETLSILDLMNAVEETVSSSKNDYNNHIVIGIDISSKGVPSGGFLKVDATPLEIIACIEILKERLDEIKDGTMAQLREEENEVRNVKGTSPLSDGLKNNVDSKIDMLDKLFTSISSSSLPENVKDELKEVHKSFREAHEAKNIMGVLEALKKLKEITTKHDSGLNFNFGFGTVDSLEDDEDDEDDDEENFFKSAN